MRQIDFAVSAFTANLSPCDSSAMSSKNCSVIPSALCFPKARNRASCRRPGSFQALRLGRAHRAGRSGQDKNCRGRIEHSARRHPHHQSRHERGTGEFHKTLSFVTPRKRLARHRGPRGDVAAELFRNHDAGDAPGGRGDLRRIAHHEQPAPSALFRSSKPRRTSRTASSCMVMEVEDTRIGEGGVLFMADCGVIPDPTVDQLADIAVSTARLARHMLGVKPRVAFLSFSTKGSASHPSVGKVQAATAQARQKAKQLFIRGRFRRRTAGGCCAHPGSRRAQVA